jgi:hypothetical protein
MHPNANIAFQLQETSNLLDAVISTQPRVSSSGNGSGSTDAIVAALCADILQNMPEDLSMDEATPGLFDRNSTDGKLNSLSVVLGQEVERFTRLSGVMRSSLAQLQAAIKGLVVMSEPLEAAYNALLLNEVRMLLAVCCRGPSEQCMASCLHCICTCSAGLGNPQLPTAVETLTSMVMLPTLLPMLCCPVPTGA